MTPLREDLVAKALRDVVEALDELEIDYLAIGGIAGALRGVDKPVRDIDIFLREDDVQTVLETLGARGFTPEESGHDWLAKATRHDVLVDLIHRIDKRIEITDEMIKRASTEEVMGTDLRVIGPEDLVLTLAITDRPDTHYWKDALIVLGNSEIDWAYLLKRAEGEASRLLALLLHARSYEIDVPQWALSELARRSEELHGHDEEGYLAARAKEALVHDERVSEPSLDITCERGTIVVRGVLPTEERRDAVEVVLKERFPGVAVDNQTTVAGAEEPAGAEKV